MDQEPPAFSVVNAGGASPVFLLCEHAANDIPAEFNNLGLPPAELTRHIAYDIGAANVARQISALLDAPLVLSGYSRLLIDCNRPLSAPSSIPLRSEATDIPGNLALSAAERDARARRFFIPFRDQVGRMLDARVAAGQPTLLIGMHSFTPVYLGVPRIWQAGVLYLRAQRLGQALLAGLREAAPALTIGDNEPYSVTLEGDFTVPWQGEARGLATALFEVRQDLIGDPAGVAEWAARLAAVLAKAAADPAAVAELAGANA